MRISNTWGELLARTALVTVLASCALSSNAEDEPRAPGASESNRIDIVALNNTRQSRGAYNEHMLTQAFWVDAGEAKLNLSCEITQMQIDGKAIERATPLLVDKDYGCVIEVPDAVASIGGMQRRKAEFKADSADASAVSDYVTFETRDGGEFKQDVYISVKWKDSATMQFAGKYSGAIRLVATIPGELEKIK